MQRLQSTPMLATMLLHQRAKKGAQPPPPTPLGTAEVDLSSLLLPRRAPQIPQCTTAFTLVLELAWLSISAVTLDKAKVNVSSRAARACNPCVLAAKCMSHLYRRPPWHVSPLTP